MIRLLLSAFVASALFCHAESNWPQFRGPGGLGIGTGKPPVEFEPEKNVLWKVEVPHGHSSPCIWGDKIILTGFDAGKLVTFCLNRADGRELWRAVAPAEKIEGAHRIGSPASSTPCTDGGRVYVYFGSFGVLAYDLDGKEVWRKALPAPVVEFGTWAVMKATASSWLPLRSARRRMTRTRMARSCSMSFRRARSKTASPRSTWTRMAV